VYHAPREVEVDGPCAASFGYGSRSFSVKAAGAFALLAIWFALGTIAFYYFKQLSLTDAFLTAVYFRVQPGSLWVLYAFWGQCVLFGIVVSIFQHVSASVAALEE